MEDSQINEVRTSLMRVAELLDGIKNPDWLSEAICQDAALPPRAFAQIAMIQMGEFDTEAKKYWLDVVDHMGPDWLAQWKMIGAFMSKTDEFRSTM